MGDIDGDGGLYIEQERGGTARLLVGLGLGALAVATLVTLVFIVVVGA
jgi:hypothetical protein